VTDIVLLGDRSASFVTHRALDALAEQVRDRASLRWVPTSSADVDELAAADGVWAVPGTPYADGDTVVEVLRRRREGGRATLGTCGGFQHMVVEYARDVAGLVAAGHGETDPTATDLVVAPLACSLVGEVRTVTAVPGSRIAEICGAAPFPGFHFCSYGVNDRYRGALSDAGLVLSAYADDAGVEAIELPGPAFWIGTLFQPQMSALDGAEVHPLVAAFLDAAR
jgi:CTP synthase (UTP-ammonia lyase)